jgi:hypothetical protein
LEILHDLETTTYYADKNLSIYTLMLARRIIHVILRWADMLIGLAVSVSNVHLLERVCHLTNKIYREMLCITRHEGMTAQIITMDGLNPHELSPHWQASRVRHCLQYRIILSWDLLFTMISLKDGIPCSFTSFITTPELSGPFHISPDIYHTQITEYSLQTIYQ